MDFPARRGVRTLREHGVLPVVYRGSNYLGQYRPVWNTVTSRRPFGTNVFEREWDLLVILDACRVDALRTLADSLDWLGRVGGMRSVGSMSAEWMLKTFTTEYEEEIAETAFVSGNIWSHRIFDERLHEHDDHDYGSIREGRPDWNVVSSETFAHYETVYPFGNQDARLHPNAEHVPHVVTDRTIEVGRNADWERLVVHYSLPHLNYVADALEWEPGATTQSELMSGDLGVTRELRPEEKSFDPAKRGEVPPETYRRNFRRNLRFALEYVEILLRNVDAEKVVISADHGEGFGENGVWSHPFGCPFSPVKTVPWARTTASDERTYRPRFDALERPPTEPELREHLKAMGYR